MRDCSDSQSWPAILRSSRDSSVLELSPEVADDVAPGEDLGFGGTQPLSDGFELVVVQLVDFDVECFGFASDATGHVVLPVSELHVDLLYVSFSAQLGHWVPRFGGGGGG